MRNLANVKIRKVLTKSDIKRINSLKRKSKRKENGLFVVEGVKIVRELMDSDFKIQQRKGPGKFLQCSQGDARRKG